LNYTSGAFAISASDCDLPTSGSQIPGIIGVHHQPQIKFLKILKGNVFKKRDQIKEVYD
jgi:hypothetical protein